MLYLPTKDENTIFTSATLSKGQLYNVDLNQYLEFQFNPKAFEWTRDVVWSSHDWVGSSNGGDLQFINIGPTNIEIALLYIADPRAYKPNYESDYQIVKDGIVDFQAIKDTIYDWAKLLEGKQRPSKISIIVGPNAFEGVITTTTFRITEFFEDLSPKEAILTVEFREWKT